MLDIDYIRENKEIVAQAVREKKGKVSIDELLDVDKEHNDLQRLIDELGRQKNEAAKAHNVEEGTKVKQAFKEAIERYNEVHARFITLMEKVPSIPSDDTPRGDDEDDNQVIREVGEKPTFSFTPKEHWELGKALDVIDSENAALISGSRFTFLKGTLARLEFAIVQYVFDTLCNEEILKSIIDSKGLNISSKPFVPVVPPVLIRPEVMQRMGRLEPREERYHINEDDLYLVGSAEHALGPLHMDQLLEEKDLPLRYIGFSTAFRREAGAYGKDVKGILRVHQFDKLEMESFTLPEDSTSEQDLIVGLQEYMVSALGLPYQVMAICTGDMGAPDIRQIDINTWMPGQNRYRETHTSDLMGDFQARRLHTRVKRVSGHTQFVHMNDATAFAIGRILIAIMENYQQEEGSVLIPKILQPYCGGLTRITSPS